MLGAKSTGGPFGDMNAEGKRWPTRQAWSLGLVE